MAGAVTIAVGFLIVIVAVVLIFSFFSGSLKTGGQGAGHVAASGTLQAGSNGLSATVTVEISNTGMVSVSSIAFMCPSALFLKADCNGLTALYNGVPVSSQNALPKKGVATGAATEQAAMSTTFSYGTLYSITCTVAFSDGESQTLTIPLAQG